MTGPRWTPAALDRQVTGWVLLILVAAIGISAPATDFFGRVDLGTLLIAPAAALFMGRRLLRTADPGARPLIIAAAAVGIAAGIGATYEILGLGARSNLPGGVLVPVVVVVASTVVLLLSLWQQDTPAGGPVARARRHLVILILAIATLAATTGFETAYLADQGALTAGNVARNILPATAVGLALVGWWWGHRLLIWFVVAPWLVLELVLFRSLQPNSPAQVAYWVELLALLVAAFIGPRAADARTWPGVASSQRAFAGRIALYGAILAIPTLMLAYLGSALTFDCGDCGRSPQADLFGAVEVPLALILIGLGSAATRRQGHMARRAIGVLGVIGAVTLLADILLSLYGGPAGSIGYFGIVLPAAVTMLVGFALLAATAPEPLTGGRAATFGVFVLSTLAVWIDSVGPDFRPLLAFTLVGVVEGGVLAAGLLAYVEGEPLREEAFDPGEPLGEVNPA